MYKQYSLLCFSAFTLSLGVPTQTFTTRDAIRAEWNRKPPALTEAQRAKLSPADRTRLDLTLKRIGAPGAPDLLPPELANPTVELWLQKASIAKTPQERFTALFFLNRFKSPSALEALKGLKAEDAKAWPKHLHLEAGVATARLNGAEIGDDLKAFLEELQHLGKIDPVRAQAAQLRLKMGGKEKALRPALLATEGNALALMDAWNRGPIALRNEAFPIMREGLSLGDKLFYFKGEGQPRDLQLGLEQSHRASVGLLQRLMDGLQPQSDEERNLALQLAQGAFQPVIGNAAKWRYVGMAAMGALSRSQSPSEEIGNALAELASRLDPLAQASLLPAIRRHAPAKADQLRDQLFDSPHAIARATAIEDLSSAPESLKALTSRVWNDTEFEPQQTLIQSYARWKLSSDDQKAQLAPWLQHPDWACRWEAYQALKKLDPSTPWPDAPAPTKEQTSILQEAEKLATKGKSVRLRITFEGKRVITLRLDPTVAPINVANLAHLARKGFFNGRRVPRVVPDFVVQMGSPYDTMDGGPGYSVRCEDSLNWYGPGSVGMALGGKDTGGSQFFITTNATPHLTGKYTRMGEVEDLDHAMAILDDLELGAKILRIEVLER
jgi:cyclophilin family peptidyl-prolyl cis-trans isomerase